MKTLHVRNLKKIVNIIRENNTNDKTEDNIIQLKSITYKKTLTKLFMFFRCYFKRQTPNLKVTRKMRDEF